MRGFLVGDTGVEKHSTDCWSCSFTDQVSLVFWLSGAAVRGVVDSEKKTESKFGNLKFLGLGGRTSELISMVFPGSVRQNTQG